MKQMGPAAIMSAGDNQDVAYLSESAVYRILDSENLLYRWANPCRGTGDAPPPPTAPHQRWHTDIMHLRVGNTWYFLVSSLMPTAVTSSTGVCCQT
jgi:hypothetical protein